MENSLLLWAEGRAHMKKKKMNNKKKKKTTGYLDRS